MLRSATRFNRRAEAVAPQALAVLLRLILRARKHHGDTRGMCLLHDLDGVVDGVALDDFDENLDNVFPPVVIVVVCRWGYRTVVCG